MTALTEIGQHPLLGRYPMFDPRSLAYPMRAILGPTSAITWTKRVWTPGPILDQGQTGHCVAFGVTAEINATPVRDDENSDEAQAFFERVHAQDVLMGNNFSDGATVLAGAKAAQADGRIGTYRWGATVEDIVDCLVTKGPVVLGTNWYNDMFTPDTYGRVKPTGGYAGGHCYLAIGFWPVGRLPGITKDAIEFQQSWGLGWGHAGHFFMTLPDVSTLMGQYGDALIATDIRQVVTV